MKNMAVHKVKDLNGRARLALEGLLGRKLREAEEVTVVATSSSAPANGGPTCYDLARRARLIGAAKDAPADLSTNPKHMEGFGRE